MRLKHIPHAKAFLEQHEAVQMLTETSTVLDLAPAAEYALEIGCGRGDFIIQKAQQQPNVTFYALEKYDSVLFKAVEKLETIQVRNIQFISGDAEDLAVMFPEKSLDVIYLNFSDPWPKKRHAKRRLTYRKKLDLYESLLKDSGWIELKSDNQLFFESTLCELSLRGWEILEISLDLYGDNRFECIKSCQTEYEKRFIRKGQTIRYLKAVKR